MRRSRTGAAVLAGLALTAAACGGGGEADQAKLDEGVKSEVKDQLQQSTTSTTSATKAPETTEEFEAFWKTQRDAWLTRIKTGKWGVDKATNTLNGPEGYKIDLSKCPQGWSDIEGLTDTEIKIGQSTAFSGTLADYGNMSRGMQSYFDYVNAAGGIKDVNGKSRKLVLTTKDDAYDPARGIPNVDELLDRDKAFLIHNGGSAIVMRTYDKLNQRCVPHPFAWTGHPAWGDPVNHPWTTGSILSYFTEAILWGSYIEKSLPPGVTVAGLVMNNDFGKAYEAGFNSFLKGSSHNIKFEVERIEPTAPNVTNEMTTLASKKPDVFIAMTAGTTCTQAIQEASQNGLNQTAKQLWQPSVCKPISFVGKDKVGTASNGWLIAGGAAADLNDPAWASSPAGKFAIGLLQKANIDPKSSSNLSAGFLHGWPMVEALRVASQLDGGLSRTNFMLAMRTMDVESPFLLKGVRMSLNGNKDAYLIEGSEFARFDSTKQSWVQEGAIIDLSGKSAPCVWDQNVSNCK